jgi:glycosyltransferase involved in cell wall biosynthesis
LKSIDTYCRNIKREGVSKAKNLNIVAISEFMVDFCKNSYVLKGFPITLIHNGVDTTIFHPSDKQEARKKTGLQPNAVIFLFSSFFMDDPNKGIDRAVAALEKIDVPNKVIVCLGGLYEKVHIQSSFPVIFAGRINDPDQISLYYSAADYFLQCSYEETFSQTPLEAMACGIPVITTPCSGAIDIIRPFNGIICKGYDKDAIAKGIKEAMDKQYNSDELRHFIIDNFNYNIIAKQYISLYDKLLKL